MKLFDCPSCGAQIKFVAADSIYATCSYCSSTVVRTDIDVELIGKVSAVLDDMTPFQIGTVGSYHGDSFEIIGRTRLAWSDGAWNEWNIIFDDGNKAWLAEAQGTYAICYEIKDIEISENSFYSNYDTKSSGLKLGAFIQMANDHFKVVDIKEAKYVGFEGELPAKININEENLVIDMVGHNNDFASIEIINNVVRAFVGNYVKWSDLRCSNFRQIEGWQ